MTQLKLFSSFYQWTNYNLGNLQDNAAGQIAQYLNSSIYDPIMPLTTILHCRLFLPWEP